MKMKHSKSTAALVLAVSLMIATHCHAAGGASYEANEAKWIETIKSGPTPEKAIACKQLAVCGTKNAVPVLAPLLLDKELCSWARIALESITDPSADDALRDALNKVQGRQLIGVINSIGFRRDAKSVDALVQKLGDPNADVATVAAVALGKIGGEPAAKALEQALAGGAPAIRSGVAEGLILCAEQFQAAGNAPQAVKAYDAIRKADVPKQRLLEATRGAILARGNDGIALMVEQLRSTDKGLLNIGMRVARELPGPQVQAALVAELAKADAERQALLIYALSDRNEPASLPVVLQSAKTGAKNVRVAALGALEVLGNASCVGLLLDAAGDADAEVSQAAKTTLARLQGKEVEAELLAHFQKATGKMRQALIELAAQRRIEGTFPIIAKCAEDPDAGVRAAAVETIGAMGEDKEAVLLVGIMQKTKDPQERATIEKALMTLTGRCGAPCVPHLLPMLKDGNAELKAIALHGLAGAGGADGLAAVKSALDDKDEAVQDEAVRTLSTWPNRWPEDAAVTAPLLSIATSPKKPQYKVLALRGYMQYLQGSKTLKDPDKLAKMKEVLPLLSRPEEKRLAISALREMGSGGAIDLLVSFAAEPGVTEEACSAIVNSKVIAKIGKPQRTKALQVVIEKSKIDATKRKAEELLKGK